MTWLSDNIMAVKAEKLYWDPAVELNIVGQQK